MADLPALYALTEKPATSDEFSSLPESIPDAMMEIAARMGMVSVLGLRRALSQYNLPYTVYRNGAPVDETADPAAPPKLDATIFEAIGLWRDTLREQIAAGRRVIVWRREPEYISSPPHRWVSWRLHFLEDARVFDLDMSRHAD